MCPQAAQSTETLALSLLCLHAWGGRSAGTGSRAAQDTGTGKVTPLPRAGWEGETGFECRAI